MNRPQQPPSPFAAQTLPTTAQPLSLVDALERAFLAIVTDPRHVAELRALRGDERATRRMLEEVSARLGPIAERELGPLFGEEHEH